ncbi:hypothetical protein YC2023_039015 [Brassica napus]|uniref:Uncharacterized protein n=1 Tax=Brassica oleracea TaxID=3712 RepID=A0A3P6AML0_BRAOL|nr:unnamed protein product [Brassica oleracea]
MCIYIHKLYCIVDVISTVLTLCITLLYPRGSFRFEIQNKATHPSAGGRSYHRRRPNHHGRLSSVPEPNYKPEDTQKQSSLRLKTKLRVDKIPLPTKPPLLQSTRIEKALTPLHNSLGKQRSISVLIGMVDRLETVRLLTSLEPRHSGTKSLQM